MNKKTHNQNKNKKLKLNFFSKLHQEKEKIQINVQINEDRIQIEYKRKFYFYKRYSANVYFCISNQTPKIQFYLRSSLKPQLYQHLTHRFFCLCWIIIRNFPLLVSPLLYDWLFQYDGPLCWSLCTDLANWRQTKQLS